LSFEEFSGHLDALGYAMELPKFAGSVYLCGACALQRPTGLRMLEGVYFPAVRETIARARLGADVVDDVDDVLQTVRERLLVEPELRIAKYRGNGPLRAWLGVIASNAIRDRMRCKREGYSLRETSWSSEMVEPADVESSEWMSLSRECTRPVEVALNRAILKLENKHRRLLELHFVHGVGIDDLAPLIGAHRSSVARQIKRIVRMLADAVHRQLLPHGGLRGAVHFQVLVSGLCGSLGVELATLLGPREGTVENASSLPRARCVRAAKPC
jgi:RNA polymerase sigma-70 factor